MYSLLIMQGLKLQKPGLTSVELTRQTQLLTGNSNVRCQELSQAAVPAGGEKTVLDENQIKILQILIHLGYSKVQWSKARKQQPVDFARFCDVCSDDLVLGSPLFGNGACACSDMCAQSRAAAAVVRSR